MTYPDPDLVLPAALACRTCTRDGLAVVGCDHCSWTVTVADELPAINVAESWHETDARHAGTWELRGAVAA